MTCAVRAVLEKVAPDAPPAELDRLAKSILMHAAVTRHVRPNAARSRKPIQAVKRARHCLEKLDIAIRDMAELVALEAHAPKGSPPVADMLETLRLWNNSLSAASDDLARMAPGERQRGQPKNDVAQDVAKYGAKIYETLTGEAPHRRRNDRETGRPTGPFCEFLTDLFAAMGIAANADHVMRDMERNS